MHIYLSLYPRHVQSILIFILGESSTFHFYKNRMLNVYINLIIILIFFILILNFQSSYPLVRIKFQHIHSSLHLISINNFNLHSSFFLLCKSSTSHAFPPLVKVSNIHINPRINLTTIHLLLFLDNDPSISNLPLNLQSSRLLFHTKFLTHIYSPLLLHPISINNFNLHFLQIKPSLSTSPRILKIVKVINLTNNSLNPPLPHSWRLFILQILHFLLSISHPRINLTAIPISLLFLPSQTPSISNLRPSFGGGIGPKQMRTSSFEQLKRWRGVEIRGWR